MHLKNKHYLSNRRRQLVCPGSQAKSFMKNLNGCLMLYSQVMQIVEFCRTRGVIWTTNVVLIHHSKVFVLFTPLLNCRHLWKMYSRTTLKLVLHRNEQFRFVKTANSNTISSCFTNYVELAPSIGRKQFSRIKLSIDKIFTLLQSMNYI